MNISASPGNLLEFRDIWKSFSGVPVLRGVSFVVPAGQTVGLVGENGAGKSTLMNILGGNLTPEAGRLLWHGQVYAPRSPTDATRHGVAFIHQELNLFPNLTIAENLFLTAFPRTAGLPWIHGATLRRKTAALLAQVGLAHAPDTPLERLSAGERQLVEVAKALSVEARLLILDEPTTSLSAREAAALFALLARLRERGLSMIYISHTLSEVLSLCDQIVVLRDGEVAGAGPRMEFDADRLISLMVGRTLGQLFPKRRSTRSAAPPVPQTPEAANSESGAVVLEAQHLTHPGIVRDISFRLHRGEVLGLAGLMGAGRSELARILFGLDPCQRGAVLLRGQALTRPGPRRRIQRGLAFVSEDRRAEGLCLEAAIADNIALASFAQYARPPLGLLDFAALRESIRAIRQAVRLTPSAREEAPVKTLSGGNQQKVVLARWLLAKPSVLLLDEPTRGIDVGAKFEVYQLIHDLADQGTGVLVISSELEELIGLCDRILVMSRGEIRDELARAEFDQQRILRAALQT